MGTDTARTTAMASGNAGLEDTRFLVSHELQALPCGGTRIVYAIRVEGPEAATLGPLVTADFAELLAALQALAGQAPTSARVEAMARAQR